MPNREVETPRTEDAVHGFEAGGDGMNGLVVIGLIVGAVCCAMSARDLAAGIRRRFSRRGWAARDALRRV